MSQMTKDEILAHNEAIDFFLSTSALVLPDNTKAEVDRKKALFLKTMRMTEEEGKAMFVTS